MAFECRYGVCFKRTRPTEMKYLYIFIRAVVFIYRFLFFFTCALRVDLTPWIEYKREKRLLNSAEKKAINQNGEKREEPSNEEGSEKR